MNLRKTVFSYLLLGFFVLLSVFCVFCTLETAGFSRIFGWPFPVLIGIACLYLLITVGVFTAIRTLLWEIGRHIPDKKREKKVSEIVFPVLTILGIAVYLILYLMYHIPFTLNDDTYYSMALVREGNGAIAFPYGVSGLYVRMLHGMLLIFGNTPFAGAVLQIVLLFVCLVMLYAGMRAYAGAFPAAVSAALFGYFSISMEYVFLLTPVLFYIALYLSAFCLTSFLHHKFFRESTVFSGLYLLIFSVGVYEGFLCASNYSLWAGQFIGVGSTVFNRENILQVFYMPYYACVAYLLLISMAFFVVPAFFTRKKGQNSAFILNLFLLYGFCFLRIEGLQGNLTAVLGWCMLAGCGICGMVSLSEKAEKESVIADKEENSDVTDGEKEITEQEITEQEITEQEIMENREQKKPAPGEPLHNPLPVPKRRNRPQADFGFEVEEKDMKFDVEVSENDDFDL